MKIITFGKACGLGLLAVVGLGIACIGGTDAPTLISPGDGDTVSGDQLTLSWSAVESATHYRLEISRDEFLTSPAVSEDSLPAASYTVDLSGFDPVLEGGVTYYWHVGAYVEGWGSWSTANSFYNANPNPN